MGHCIIHKEYVVGECAKCFPPDDYPSCSAKDAELTSLRLIVARVKDVGGIAAAIADEDLNWDLYCDGTKRIFAFARAVKSYAFGEG